MHQTTKTNFLSWKHGLTLEERTIKLRNNVSVKLSQNAIEGYLQIAMLEGHVKWLKRELNSTAKTYQYGHVVP